MISLVLPYPISANRYWRPVRIGAHITIVPTKEAKAYRTDVAWRARAAGVREPLQGRVKIEIDLYPHRPLDWQKRVKVDPVLWADTVQCIDLGNCEKVLGDALNGVAYLDDKQHHRIELERFDPDEHGARVVVRVSPFLTRHPQAALPLPVVRLSPPAAAVDNTLFFEGASA